MPNPAPGLDNTRIVKLKGLPYSATKRDVAGFFNDLEVIFVHFVFEADNRPSGLAFVELSNHEHAQEAVKRRGQYLLGRYIKVLLVSYQEMIEQVLLGTPAIPRHRPVKERARVLAAAQAQAAQANSQNPFDNNNGLHVPPELMLERAIVPDHVLWGSRPYSPGPDAPMQMYPPSLTYSQPPATSAAPPLGAHAAKASGMHMLTQPAPPPPPSATNLSAAAAAAAGAVNKHAPVKNMMTPAPPVPQPPASPPQPPAASAGAPAALDAGTSTSVTGSVVTSEQCQEAAAEASPAPATLAADAPTAPPAAQQPGTPPSEPASGPSTTFRVMMNGDVVPSSNSAFQEVLSSSKTVSVSRIQAPLELIELRVAKLFGRFCVDLDAVVFRLEDDGDTPTGDIWLQLDSESEAKRASETLTGTIIDGKPIQVSCTHA